MSNLPKLLASVCACVLVWGSSAAGQSGPEADYAAAAGQALAPISPGGDVFEAYLAAAGIPVESDPQAAIAAGQPVAMAMAIAGEEDEARAVMSAHVRAMVQQMTGDRPGGELPSRPMVTPKYSVDAIERIRTLARSHDIVMLNEHHHVSGNRAFAERLFSALQEDGFQALAVEALAATPGAFDLPVTPADGLYMNDPRFASLIATFIENGGVVRGYEWTPQQEISREQQMANSIVAMLESAPDGKLLIYCGAGHASEETRWLAGLLKEMTGLDPLTIDQAGGTAHARDVPMSAGYWTLDDAARLDEPAIHYLENDEPHLDPASGVFDLLVVHPELEPINGRPGWWRFMTGYAPTSLDGLQIPTVRPLMLEARASQSGVDAVPADRVIVGEGEDTPDLFLKPGEYEVVAHTADGEKRLGTIQVTQVR